MRGSVGEGRGGDGTGRDPPNTTTYIPVPSIALRRCDTVRKLFTCLPLRAMFCALSQGLLLRATDSCTIFGDAAGFVSALISVGFTTSC